MHVLINPAHQAIKIPTLELPFVFFKKNYGVFRKMSSSGQDRLGRARMRPYPVQLSNGTHTYRLPRVGPFAFDKVALGYNGVPYGNYVHAAITSLLSELNFVPETTPNLSDQLLKSTPVDLLELERMFLDILH